MNIFNNLEKEDLNFIINFVLSSGSLKDMASMYGVTYPTMRLRLDRIIKKIELLQNVNDESFILFIKKMAIDEKIDYQSAKELIDMYRVKHPKEDI